METHSFQGFRVLVILPLLVATVIGGLTDTDLILVNDTGLDISNVMIDSRSLHELKQHDKMLVSVTPEKHHLKLIFRGGGDIDWPRFNFLGVHEIFFERDGVGFRARIQ